MKRINADSLNTGGVVSLLERAKPMPAASNRVFECKTCSRRFASFQALGGHRASHRKPRVVGEGGAQGHAGKVHGCPICGVEFGIGQALGGHMRRHRAGASLVVHGGKKRVWLDLNLPPPSPQEEEEDVDMDCIVHPIRLIASTD